MSTYSLFIFAAACVAALFLWSSVAKVKGASETLLNEYEKLLAEARKKMSEPDADNQDDSSSEGEESADRRSSADVIR